MITIENITYSTINGLKEFAVEIFDDSTQKSTIIGLPRGKWNKSVVVNALIRSKYPQDVVEAMVNNHLLLLAEWQDKIYAGKNPGKLEDPEYDELQAWRAVSKELAVRIIDELNKIQ